MSPLRITLLLVLTVLRAMAVAPAVPPELRGILVLGRSQHFALVASGGEHSGWATVGETFEGWKLAEYVAADEALILEDAGKRVTVYLHQGAALATTATYAPPSSAKVTVQAADGLLQKMNFDAMWKRIADEQRKAIVSGIRPQIVAELTKAGLPSDEIDGLLAKMGEVMTAGLASEAMRKDFERIYAEVYTPDELRGMTDFYETAAGQAWTAKQPEVQQKLMQAMMPRVMEGMPAAQKLVADYMRNRAATQAAQTAKP